MRLTALFSLHPNSIQAQLIPFAQETRKLEQAHLTLALAFVIRQEY